MVVAAVSGKWEWESGPAAKRGFTESGGALDVRLSGGGEESCSGESATGEYTGAKTVEDRSFNPMGWTLHAELLGEESLEINTVV
jgi:hypothetical protein